MMDLNERMFGRGLLHTIKPDVSGVLAQKFLLPPFSVLNARDGVWQDRKRRWLSLGLEGEIGRGSNLLRQSATIARELGKIGDTAEELEEWKKSGQGRSVSPGGSAMPSTNYSKDKSRGDGGGSPFQASGRKGQLTINAKDEEGYAESTRKVARYGSTTSIFDPVLTEILYRWFCPIGGQVVDPFAGGSVRGIIAHLLGNRYWGCDLRQEQIDCNEAQAESICPDNKPTWVVGDALNCAKDAPEADFILGCPPYGNLEQYCDDPRDLSNMDLGQFRKVYAEIIRLTCDRLKEDRFAAFVVGDYRGKDGNYCNFPWGTILSFQKAGMHLYNEAVLITSITSLGIRSGRHFNNSRKLGKGHQNVLIFVKGDGRRAAEYVRKCGGEVDGVVTEECRESSDESSSSE